MKIGLFDHLERSPDRALSTQFDERLEFAAAADAAAGRLHIDVVGKRRLR